MFRRRHHHYALIIVAFALFLVLGIAAEILAHVWLIIAGIALVGIVRYFSVKPRASARIPARATTAPKVITSEVIRDDTETGIEPESWPESERDRLVSDRRSGARPLFGDNEV